LSFEGNVSEVNREVGSRRANVPCVADLEKLEDRVPRWFAVYTAPRHEKRLGEHFKVRQIEYFLPLYRTPRRWKDGSRVTLELPLFPNYIFVRICRNQRVRILEVPGVLSIAGCGREPAALPDEEIEALRQGMIYAKIEPHPYLVVGERVRINNGPLLGMEGVLIRKKKSFRVVLTISTILQSLAVELDIDDLEPAKPTLHPMILPSVRAA
jgi:transcription antitermination factor NusG